MDQLVLVRHGESLGNVARERAYAEHADVIDIAERDADVALSDRGRRQAAAVAAVLETGDDVTAWSSNYLRALQTAELALPPEMFARLQVDERLRDRELGILDKLTGWGILDRFPDEARRRRELGKFFHRPPGGESWADVVLRLRSWLHDVGPGRHVVFAHDAVIVLVRYVLEHLDEATALRISDEQPLSNASITVLRREDGGAWVAVAHGDSDHLGHLETEHPPEPDAGPAS
ncbi:histidine phosphatase family protein [Jatrophihabitans sp. YIM 134969]